MSHHSKVRGRLPSSSCFLSCMILQWWTRSVRTCSFAMVFSILGNCLLSYFCYICVWKFPQFSLRRAKSSVISEGAAVWLSRSCHNFCHSVSSTFIFIYILPSVRSAFLAHLHTVSNLVCVCVYVWVGGCMGVCVRGGVWVSDFPHFHNETHAVWSLCAVTRQSSHIPLSLINHLFSFHWFLTHLWITAVTLGLI